MALAQQTYPAIFVAWQDPDSRRFHTVARLLSGIGTEGMYEFAYVQGACAAKSQGFKPFLAFPEPDRVYRSLELFPFFKNRLMGRDRDDFPTYVAQLGLNPAEADDMTILARSGGVRATDKIELFPVPVFDPNLPGYRTTFLVHGLSHFDAAHRQRAERLRPGERLLFMSDCQNPADPNAIALRTTDDRLIVGYLPRYLLSDAWTLVQSCDIFEVYVEQVNPPPAPLQQRVLCRLESCWPDDDFVPFAAKTYQPIAPDATILSTR